MAACGLERIFEKPLPENPTLLESLSAWNQIQPIKPIGLSQLTEIFGELHFKEKQPPETIESPAAALPPPASSWPSPLIDSSSRPKSEKPNLHHHNKSASMDSLLGNCKSEYMGCPMHSDCFLSRNSESLMQPYTEGLGFESSDEVEAKNDCSCDKSNDLLEKEKQKAAFMKELGGSFKVSRIGDGSYPPPLTCIGKMGKPGFRFQSYKQDGRFILKEVKIPSVEFMHASREDGRLKLHLVQPDDEPIKEEDEEDMEEDEEEVVEEEEHEQGEEDEETILEEEEGNSGMVEGIS